MAYLTNNMKYAIIYNTILNIIIFTKGEIKYG